MKVLALSIYLAMCIIFKMFRKIYVSMPGYIKKHYFNYHPNKLYINLMQEWNLTCPIVNFISFFLQVYRYAYLYSKYKYLVSSHPIQLEYLHNAIIFFPMQLCTPPMQLWTTPMQLCTPLCITHQPPTYLSMLDMGIKYPMLSLCLCN